MQSLVQYRLSILDCEVRENRLYYKGRLWIPDDSVLRLLVIEGYHNTPLCGHGRKSKTYELL